MRDRTIVVTDSRPSSEDDEIEIELDTAYELENPDNRFSSQIENHTKECTDKATAYLKAGDLNQALTYFNEAARSYSKIKPISKTVASAYLSIADIHNKPGDQRDIEQALYFYEKALGICTRLFNNAAYASQIDDLYDGAFLCESRMGAIYYEIGVASDCKIGTPYHYDFCLMSEDMKIEPDKLYFAREKGEIVYWVIKNDNPVKGSIDSIPIPIPFTIDNLNFHKKQILEMTSQAGHTRCYDEIDAQYAKKMKEKSTAYNKQILSAYIKKYGITSPLIADCCNHLGNLYRSIKQDEIANYFFENANCLNHLKKLFEKAHPYAYAATHAECIRETTKTGIAFDAAVVSSFIKEYAKKNRQTAKCCTGIGALYYFIEQKTLANDFFNLASEIAVLENAILDPVKESEEITDSVMALQKAKKETLLKKCRHKVKKFIETEEKKPSTSLFHSNTLFSNNSNARGRFYNDSFINTSTATFIEDNSLTQPVTTRDTGIFGFLQSMNQENEYIPVNPNGTGVLEFLEESNQSALDQKKNPRCIR